MWEGMAAAEDNAGIPKLSPQKQPYGYFCAKLQLVGTCALSVARDTIRVFPSGHAP